MSPADWLCALRFLVLFSSLLIDFYIKVKDTVEETARKEKALKYRSWKETPEKMQVMNGGRSVAEKVARTGSH